LAHNESRTLSNTWDECAGAAKLFPDPSSEPADTTASCETEGSSDDASQHSNVGEDECPRCSGNGYHESRLGTFTCKTCNGRGYADLRDEAIPGRPLGSAIVGVLVVRGPDWQYGDDDGGAGSIGEVVKDVGGGWVQVRWSSGHIDDYRAGVSNRRDLVVHKITEPNGYVSEQAASDAASLYAASMYAALCQRASYMPSNGMPFGWGIQDGPMMPFGWGGHDGAKMFAMQLPPTQVQPPPVTRTPLRRNAPLFISQQFP